MAYHALPPFDPSATYVATAKLGRFNGVPTQAGERIPASPADPGAAQKYTRVLRTLYEARKIALAPAAAPEPRAKGRRPEPRPGS